MKAAEDDGVPLAGRDLEAWLAAQRFWDASVALRPPRTLAGEAVAYIDLETRATRVNLDRLRDRGVLDRLPCVLAHEVGHHIRWPHTLLEHRKMLLFLRTELPPLVRQQARGPATCTPTILAQHAAAGQLDFLLNLYLDVRINHDMVVESGGGGAEAPPFLDDFVALYRALVTRDRRAKPGAVMSFYLALYEALWYLPEGTLTSPAMRAALDAASPPWRGEAQALAQFLEAERDRPYLGLARFLLACVPYLLADGDAQGASGVLEGNDPIRGTLDPDDVPRLTEEDPDAREARRLLRPDAGDPPGADAAGRLPGADATRPPGPARDPAAGFPSRGLLDSLAGIATPGELVLAWYRRTAQRIAYELPGSLVMDPTLIPGPTDRWEPGDELHAIDWTATLGRSAVAIPGVTTLRRTHLVEEPVRGTRERPWIELYIDSSGSMPNPIQAMNPQVLAGFALVRAATEALGRVRVVQYSGERAMKAMEGFTASAEPAYRALLEYIGGGTHFPFAELARSVARWRAEARVFRIVMSDADFLANVFSARSRKAVERNLEALGRAAERGDRIIGLLVATLPDEQRRSLGAVGMELVTTTDRRELFRIAEELGRRLFPPGAQEGGAS